MAFLSMSKNIKNDPKIIRPQIDQFNQNNCRIISDVKEERETGMACRGMDDEEEGMRGKWGFTSKKCEKSPKYAIK